MPALRRILTRCWLAAACAALVACGGSSRPSSAPAGSSTVSAGGSTTGSPTPARGASPQSRLQSILQENTLLLYTPPQQQYQALRVIKSLGVDVVKVPLIWALVAPDEASATSPHFDAADPAGYPWGAWNRYDDLVEFAHQLGLKVYFQFAPPVPRWAIDPNFPRQPGTKILGQVPSFRLFNKFVQAVGTRYGGSGHDTQGRPIPRVSQWGIWNEPNWQNWLNPTQLNVNGVQVTSQPMLYRGLVNAAWKGLAATGHGSDTILIGETANIGSVTPIQFVEDMYCVAPSYQPLNGRAAEAVGCPASGARQAFVAQNPGLFHMSGFAHHPYDFDIPPDQPSTVSTEVSLANIEELEHVLNGIFAGYGRSRSGGIPIYLTEWGYVTNPPNPQYHTSLSQQATWLNQGEYMMSGQPFVKALAQFLLVDVPPPPSSSATAAAWLHSFTSGLMFYGGKPKPALAAYRIPIWLPSAHSGPSVTVWGELRPADHSAVQVGSIDFKPAGATAWRTLATVSTTNPEGFLLTHVSIPSSGTVRLAWRSPAGSVFYSRLVPVS
jgi:hypothetical protein